EIKGTQSIPAIDDLSCDCGSQSHPLNLLKNRGLYLSWVLGVVEGEEAYNPGVFEGKRDGEYYWGFTHFIPVVRKDYHC
nr:hypothetical protein [Tanacetum cinerariifolium]